MNQMRKLIALLESQSPFNVTVTGAYSGQTDFTITYTVGDKVVGKLDAVEYDGEVSISMIDVYDKRKGYGKALVRHLQSLYPETEIDWGMMTDEGSALKKSLTFKKYETEYKPLLDEYIALKERLKELQGSVDDFYEIDNPTEEEKEKFYKLIDVYNEINDRLLDIEDIVIDEAPYKNIIQ